MAKGKVTPRTLKLLRDWGWFYWQVERVIPYSFVKIDLYHIIDYVVITDHSTIGVQSCGSNFSEHLNKLCIDEVENTVKWLSCKNRKLFLIGWRMVLKKKGGKQRIYKPRISILTLEGNYIVSEEKDTYHYGL